ncbi:unnamed protein product [Cuscuta campestris]|uniref:Uncharacterized protein n=1 Tax=Cuscuta campestris TaxID=132261 RepID=A0A484MKU7_9ASTE|nr:unnamed protein product [Cuscuta campestris]
MMEAHLYALHDCMWVVLEDGPLKIQMENPERNPANPDVVQYIPKPKEKWDDRDCKKHNLDNVAKAAIFKTLDPITFSKIKHLKTSMEIWQGLLDELRTYEHELKKKKEEQVTPFPMALMTTPRVPSSEGTCPRNCNTPSSNHPSNSKMENYDEEFAMMVKQFRKFKKFFKKADSVRRPSKGKPQSACPYPKVEKYGERERNEKKKKAMVAAESDESSSSSSDEEALVCMERRAEKSNHEDRWTMSEDDTLCLMAKDDAEQEVTSQTSCSSSYEIIPNSENHFDKFKKIMEDFEEINLKHSSLTEENKLLSEENLKVTESWKSQLSEITQLKAENESLSEKVKSLNKELGTLKSKEAVDKLLETTKHKGREGLGFDPSSSKRKGKTTFIPPKLTTKPNKQKGKEKEKPTDVPKKVVPPKNYRKMDTPQKGNNFRRKPSNPHYTRGYTHYGVDRSFPRNSEWRTMPRYSHPAPQKLFVPPKYAYNRHRPHYAQPRQNYRSYQPRFARRKQEIAPPARRKFYAYNYDYNPNKFRAARKIPFNFKLDVGTHTINYSGPKLNWDMASLKIISINEVILTGKRIRNTYEVIWDDVKEACLISKVKMKIVCAIVHFRKLEGKRSSLTFYQTYLEMIAAQELSKFLHMEIHSKYEDEVLEFYRNGKVKTAQSKKNPQRTIQIIKSTVGGTKVKISQKKLEKELHLPNSGSEIGRLPAKNLDWKTTGISGQIPSGPAKKADLKNDYNAEAPHILAVVNLEEEEEEVSAQGELQRKTKRKITSPSTSENINPDELVGKEPVEEHSAHNQSPQQLDEEISQVQSSPTPSLQAQTNDAESQFMQLYYDWRAWKVGNSAEQLLEWDQQLKNEKIIKRCLGLPVNYYCEQILDVDSLWQRNYEDLHLEYLATTPVSEFEVDDEDPSVYTLIFSKATEDQMALTTEAQTNMEATTEDFQVFLETSTAFETNLAEAVQENAASP